MYPFLTENGAALREKLQKEQIYIPLLWPNVKQNLHSTDMEYSQSVFCFFAKLQESMSQESEISENILLPDLAKQSESIEQQSGEIAERGMPT